MSKQKILELEGKCTGVLEEGENIKLKIISIHELWSQPKLSFSLCLQLCLFVYDIVCGKENKILKKNRTGERRQM